MAFLETGNLTKRFGGVVAVNDVSLSVKEGEIIGLIGPNGSGKSTFINVLSGIYAPDGGWIRFRGEEITHLPAHIVTARGIARTFQNLRIFPNVSVLYNLMIGRHSRIRNSLVDVYLRPFSARRREREAEERAVEILVMAGLSARMHDPARNLAYGEQRLLEICRALASDPYLLLIDEPCAGMNPVEMDTLADFLRRLKRMGHTILVVEHNMRFIMSLAERIVVFDAGRKFREGTPGSIQADRDVQNIYLGEEEDMPC